MMERGIASFERGADCLYRINAVDDQMVVGHFRIGGVLVIQRRFFVGPDAVQVAARNELHAAVFPRDIGQGQPACESGTYIAPVGDVLMPWHFRSAMGGFMKI